MEARGWDEKGISLEVGAGMAARGGDGWWRQRKGIGEGRQGNGSGGQRARSMGWGGGGDGMSSGHALDGLRVDF
jgi:hypothetical protein